MSARTRQRSDVLTRGQRRTVVGLVLAAHLVAGWGLLQVRAVREALGEVAPVFVSLIDPPAPPVPPQPAPRVKKTRPAPVPLVTSAPTPTPAPVVEPPIEVPLPEPAPVPVIVPAPPARPAPAPPPKNIPASAVQYLEAPVLEYPRASRRAGESGRVKVRVYIDEAGLPRSLQISHSSGYTRLDEAAMAAVQRARFKPYTENGRPTAGWAFIPLHFELE